MRVIKLLILIAFLNFYSLSHAITCIPVAGLSFEKIDSNKLLAIRNGKNVAVIKTDFVPERIGSFRFFSEQLCDYGAENKYHIDGKLFEIYLIQAYR
jgi:hypothetical protein